MIWVSCIQNVIFGFYSMLSIHEYVNIKYKISILNVLLKLDIFSTSSQFVIQILQMFLVNYLSGRGTCDTDRAQRAGTKMDDEDRLLPG